MAADGYVHIHISPANAGSISFDIWGDGGGIGPYFDGSKILASQLSMADPTYGADILPQNASGYAVTDVTATGQIIVAPSLTPWFGHVRTLHVGTGGGDLFVTFGSSTAGPYSIRINVEDSVSGVYLPGVSVTVGNQTSTTDTAGGNAFFTAPAGQSNVTLQLAGYRTLNGTINTTQNGQEFDFKLESSSNLKITISVESGNGSIFATINDGTEEIGPTRTPITFEMAAGGGVWIGAQPDSGYTFQGFTNNLGLSNMGVNQQNPLYATPSADAYAKAIFQSTTTPPPTTKYSCVNGQCVEDANGQYATLADCQANCGSVSPPPRSNYEIWLILGAALLAILFVL